MCKSVIWRLTSSLNSGKGQLPHPSLPICPLFLMPHPESPEPFCLCLLQADAISMVGGTRTGLCSVGVVTTVPRASAR